MLDFKILASGFITTQSVVSMIAFLINVFVLTLFLLNYNTFCTRRNLFLSFHTIFGNLFFSLLVSYISETVKFLFTGIPPLMFSKEDCVLDIAIEVFGYSMLTLTVTLIAMERVLFVAYNHEISRKALNYILTGFYLFSILNSVLYYTMQVGTPLLSGGCAVMPQKDLITNLYIGFLILTLATCLIVTYFSYYLLVQKVYKIKFSSETDSVQK